MTRFFCLNKEIKDNKVFLTDKEQFHHLKNVLRLEIGDKGVIFDEISNEYEVELEIINKDNAVFKIITAKKRKDLQKIEICLACAIPKNTKIEDIIDKCTQLGVDRIIPLITERVIVKLDENKKQDRKKRWEIVALAACRQSQRKTIPTIDDVCSFNEALEKSKSFDLKIIPHLIGDRNSLKNILAQDKFKKVFIFIGPEGDFTPEEVEKALNNGFKAVSLGEQVLRVDTAAISVVGFIRFSDL